MNTIKSTIAAFFTSASVFVAGCSDSGNNNSIPQTTANNAPHIETPPTKLKRDNFIATIQDLAKTHQYIILGDTNHTSVEIKELLADFRVLQTLKDCDIKIIIGEGPIEQNQQHATLLEDIRANRIKYEDLLFDAGYHTNNPEKSQRMSQAHANTIWMAAQLNLQYLQPDERHSAVQEDRELNDFFDQLSSLYNEDEAYNRVVTDAFVRKNPQLKNGHNKFKQFIRYSFSSKGNEPIANNIKNLTQKNKAIIIYGSGHIEGEYDLDEMIGPDKCVTISLFPNSSSYTVSDHPDDPNRYVKSSDNPQYFYDIETDNMIKVEANTITEKKYRERVKYYFTLEEYEAAVSKLPKDFKPYALPYREYDADFSNNLPEKYYEQDLIPAPAN